MKKTFKDQKPSENQITKIKQSSFNNHLLDEAAIAEKSQLIH